MKRIILCICGVALVMHCGAGAAAPLSISGQVLGPDGKGIPEAVVFIEEPSAAPSARGAATMDQIDKTFVPGVLPVELGTSVSFPNRDQIRHHVYSFSRAKRFELPLYKGEEAPRVVFDKPGVVRIGCNIHDWMSAIILVLPNALYATTDEDGRFRIEGLAKGAYTVTAWHAQSRESTQELARRIQLDGGDAAIDFMMTLAPARARPATRGARWE